MIVTPDLAESCGHESARLPWAPDSHSCKASSRRLLPDSGAASARSVLGDHHWLISMHVIATPTDLVNLAAPPYGEDPKRNRWLRPG